MTDKFELTQEIDLNKSYKNMFMLVGREFSNRTNPYESKLPIALFDYAINAQYERKFNTREIDKTHKSIISKYKKRFIDTLICLQNDPEFFEVMEGFDISAKYVQGKIFDYLNNIFGGKEQCIESYFSEHKNEEQKRLSYINQATVHMNGLEEKYRACYLLGYNFNIDQIEFPAKISTVEHFQKRYNIQYSNLLGWESILRWINDSAYHTFRDIECPLEIRLAEYMKIAEEVFYTTVKVKPENQEDNLALLKQRFLEDCQKEAKRYEMSNTSSLPNIRRHCYTQDLNWSQEDIQRFEEKYINNNSDPSFLYVVESIFENAGRYYYEEFKKLWLLSNPSV